ncbi:MAG: AI-2E family transporter [Bacteroides sp.]|nr:AI-2E family transporter [Prevotella sp.]MCM1408265.1 AI-2E family transporter [Treponema brennaborense]MCM1470503.1 AI-2E family transporter [Bacteroides sp.]
MKKTANYARPIFLLLLFITCILAATVLKVTSTVILPIVIAVLVSLVFEPIVTAMNKRFHIPWLLGIIIILGIVATAITIIGSILFTSLKAILLQYPKYEERFITIYQIIANLYNLSYNESASLFQNLWEQLGIRNFIQNFALTFSNNIVSLIRNFLMICLFSIFFLMELQLFRVKLRYAFETAMQDRIVNIISDIIKQVSHYISIKFYTSLATGILVYFGTLAIGLDFPIVWGFLAFIANFIPTFGSIFSGVITVLFALLQFWPESLQIVLTGILMLGVNMVIGNFLEPRIQGANLGLSPFFIIASLSVWGWLCGFAGMVIAVPMTVILKIICENVSFLRPVSVLMGSSPPPHQAETQTPPHAEQNSGEAEADEHGEHEPA